MKKRVFLFMFAAMFSVSACSSQDAVSESTTVTVLLNNLAETLTISRFLVLVPEAEM